MPDAPTGGLLRRIAKAAAPPQLTPTRALRLALTRAADRSIALSLAVLGIREEEGPLDDLLSRLEGGLTILALRWDGVPSGLMALDAEARAAVVEAQVLGRVSASPSEPREPTAADAALARPLLEAFLTEAEAAVEGTPLAGWLAGPTLGERVASPREAALLLRDGRYRAVRLTLDLGAGERRGLVLILALVAEPPARDEPTPTVAPQVLQSEARLDAVLHRLRLPLAEAEGLVVGQVLPLPGVTVASARIEAGGVVLGPARLGQVAGMRAVRIESPLAPELASIPTLPDGQSASLLPTEPSWPSAGEGASPAWAPPEPVGEPEPWIAPPDSMAAEDTWPLAAGL